MEYYHTFDAHVKTMDANHAWALPPLKQDPDAAVPGGSDDDHCRSSCDRELAAAFIINSDNKRFATLKADLRDNFAHGTDQWPKSLIDAYHLLVTKERNDLLAAREKHPKRPKDPKEHERQQEKTPRDGDSHQFAMTTDRPGHHSPFLTDCILLDSKSTESIFCEASLLTNLRQSNSPLTLHTNGGKHRAQQLGDYHGLGAPLPVWYNPSSLANVLALRDVRQCIRVMLDTDAELAFLVHVPNGPPL